VVNLPLLWISALFYVALASVMYVASFALVATMLRVNRARAARPFLAASGVKRVLLAALVLPPLLAVLPTIAGTTLRHLHGGAASGMPPMTQGSGDHAANPYRVFAAAESGGPVAHHAASCQLLFDRLAALGGLGLSGDWGHAVSVAVGGAAWLLVIAGAFLAFRLVGATLRLESGIAPVLASPTPRLAGSLARVGRSVASLPRDRFYECALPAAYSSVLGLTRARCVLSSHLVAHSPNDELDAVVAHEASHLRSGDVYAAFAVGLLNCAFFFLRPVRQLGRWWREAAELASDDAAVRATRDPLALASAILRVSATPNASGSALPAVVLPFADETACFPAKRVERLLDQAQKATLAPLAETPLQIAAAWATTGVLGLVGAGLLLSSEAACVAHCALELVQRLL